MMGFFLFGVAVAAADADEAMKMGKFMSKFMPVGQIPRPVTRGSTLAQPDLSMQRTALETLVDMEAQSQEMQAEYQRLRARIQKMPQADDQSAASFGWLAGFGASVALAASVGVAAMKKYSSHGQQESEFTSGSQISLVPQRAGLVTMAARGFKEGDIGVTRPLGVFDPLGLIATRDMRRYEIMEIKHGRAAMFGFLHVILIHAGLRLPGYLSFTQDLKFADMPVGCFASLEATPTLGWLQIMAITCAAETGYAGTPAGVVAQRKNAAPGDIGGARWKRYDDPEEKAFKLNAERNNGRAAMLGITGCLIHELLGVDALYPTGGLDGAAPPTIFS